MASALLLCASVAKGIFIEVQRQVHKRSTRNEYLLITSAPKIFGMML